MIDGMTGPVTTSIGFALLAAFLYALSNVLEQGEAEQVPDEYALRPRLVVRLAGRPRWVMGFASDVGGYIASAVALSVGAVVFVQPIQSMGLLMTLFLGSAIQRRYRPGKGLAHGAGALQRLDALSPGNLPDRKASMSFPRRGGCAPHP